VLRQLWVVLTEEIARRSHAGPGDWIAALTMRKMLEWLVHELNPLHPEAVASQKPRILAQLIAG
jgi:hypothetical protein